MSDATQIMLETVLEVGEESEGRDVGEEEENNGCCLQYGKKERQQESESKGGREQKNEQHTARSKKGKKGRMERADGMKARRCEGAGYQQHRGGQVLTVSLLLQSLFYFHLSLIHI